MLGSRDFAMRVTGFVTTGAAESTAVEYAMTLRNDEWAFDPAFAGGPLWTAGLVTVAPASALDRLLAPWAWLIAPGLFVVMFAPLLIGLCLLAAGYALVRRVRWWPLPALVLGQAAALVIVSAGFSNLGPGAERYLISNVILLFPVLGAVIATLPVPWPRLAALALVALAGLVVARTTLDPPTWYPDADANLPTGPPERTVVTA